MSSSLVYPLFLKLQFPLLVFSFSSMFVVDFLFADLVWASSRNSFWPRNGISPHIVARITTRSPPGRRLIDNGVDFNCITPIPKLIRDLKRRLSYIQRQKEWHWEARIDLLRSSFAGTKTMWFLLSFVYFWINKLISRETTIEFSLHLHFYTRGFFGYLGKHQFGTHISHSFYIHPSFLILTNITPGDFKVCFPSLSRPLSPRQVKNPSIPVGQEVTIQKDELPIGQNFISHSQWYLK